MRHAILGAGGVGGLVGASLVRCGFQVTMVLKPEAVQAHPAELRLESPFGNLSAKVDRASAVPPADVLWITVKATQLDSALSALTDARSVHAIVPLLNGVDHIALLRSKYGADRIVPATISVESERVAPGHVVHRSPFVRLNIASSGRARLEGTLKCLQQIGFACQFIDDEPTLLWSKLVFLAPFALATTAAGKPKGEILSDPQRWQQLQDCVREACAVARAEGAKVEPEPVIATLAGLPPAMRSSMQKDVAQKRIPELDAIAGPILRGASRYRLDAPVTRSLVDAIQQKVTGPA